MPDNFLSSAIKLFEYYKMLGEKTFDQVSDEQLLWQYNEESNSIATIVQHISGNMLSRWTDFLTSDGEKKWRNRESEFENTIATRHELIQIWQSGWACLFAALNQLTEVDLNKEVYIRNMSQSVIEAINRQLTHYSYHVGQIVYIGKMVNNTNWTSLSIPRGRSDAYNAEKFAKPKHKEHFTDEFIAMKNKEDK